MKRPNPPLHDLFTTYAFAMGEVTFNNSGPPLVDDYLPAFEAWLGRRLPESYRNFLWLHNGGRPSPRYARVPTPRGPNWVELLHIFGLTGPYKGYTLEGGISDFPRFVWMGLLPIACDGGGGVFCLRMSGEPFGEVLFCDEPFAGDMPYVIANDFGELFSALTDLPEEMS